MAKLQDLNINQYLYRNPFWTDEELDPEKIIEGTVYSPVNFTDLFVDGSTITTFINDNVIVTLNPVTATLVIAPTGTTADYNTDGTADQTEINQAIDDLPATGGRIILREGTYTLSGPIIIDKSNVVFEGQGEGTKITLANSTNTDIIELGDGSTSYSYITVKRLFLDGNKENQTSNGIGIEVTENADFITIENCRIDNTENDGIQIHGDDQKILHNVLNSCGADGISIVSPSTRILIRGNVINSSTEEGIIVDSVANHSEISGNILVSCGSPAISENGGLSRIIGNSILVITNGNHGIVAIGGNSTVQGNRIRFNVTSASTQSIGIDVGSGTTASGNVISGADTNQKFVAFRMNDISESSVIGNITSNSEIGIGLGTGGITRCSISGNILHGKGSGSQEGIVFGTSSASGADQCTICNNVIYNFGHEGINLRFSSANVISNNNIKNIGLTTDNTYAAILLHERTTGEYSTYNIISGNHINSSAANKHSYGIRENSVNDGPTIVTNNIVLSAQTANISTQHASSEVSHNITT